MHTALPDANSMALALKRMQNKDALHFEGFERQSESDLRYE